MVLNVGRGKWKIDRKLMTAESRMLRIICGKTLKYKINNEKTRETAGVEN